MYNGADAMCLGDSPYEICDAGAGHIVCFNGEEMTDFMDWKPDSWQTTEPKEEETEKVPCIRTRTIRETVWEIVVAGPDGTDHESNTLSCRVVSKTARKYGCCRCC